MIRLNEQLILRGKDFPKLLENYQFSALMANKAVREGRQSVFEKERYLHFLAAKKLTAAILQNGQEFV